MPEGKKVKVMDSKKECSWFDKLKGYNQIIYLTEDVKKKLKLRNCNATIGLFNEKANTLMYENA